MSVTICKRIFFIIAMLGGLCTEASDLHADRDEASLHAEIPYGQAAVSDRDMGERVFGEFVTGVGMRATYATSDWYAYEFHLGYERPVGRAFERKIGSDMLWRGLSWVRADFGVTARLGVEWIPVIHAAIGIQARMGKTWMRQDGWTGPRGIQVTPEPIGIVGVGLDYRWNERWITGVRVTAQHAVSLQDELYRSVTGFLSISYYWYPLQDV